MFNINQRLSVCTIGYLLLQLAIQTNVNEKPQGRRSLFGKNLREVPAMNHVLEAGTTLSCLNNKLV